MTDIYMFIISVTLYLKTYLSDIDIIIAQETHVTYGPLFYSARQRLLRATSKASYLQKWPKQPPMAEAAINHAEGNFHPCNTVGTGNLRNVPLVDFCHILLETSFYLK